MRHIALTVMFVVMLIPVANAARDEKFYRKAAEKVWSMELPEFNAHKEIPDTSLYNNESAVIIAAYDCLEVRRDAGLNITKYATVGSGYNNAIEANATMRRMIKLNDTKAIEDYSEFEIDVKSKESISNYSYKLSNSAFGARVHKSDGTVIDVDCSSAYTVTAGKGSKKSDVEHKIAIPGLEPGDVLEYFYYDEMWVDEGDLELVEFSFLRKYPAMSYTIDCNIDPELTIEFRCLNGAPLLMGAYGKDGMRKLSVSVMNLPKKETGIWMVAARQLPMIRMRVLNNTSTLVYRTRSARRGGVYCGLAPQNYYNDIANILHDLDLPTKIVSKSTKLAKKYMEQNPDASPRQIVDAAWLATVYNTLIDEDSHSTIALSIYFADVLKKLKVQQVSGLGVVCPRKDVPVTQILHWQEPRYMNMVGDSFYLSTGDYCFQPGEVPGDYEAEQAAVLYGDRKEFLQIDAVMKHLPVSRAAQNTYRTNIAVSLNAEDNNILDIDWNVKLDGSSKIFASPAIDMNRYVSRIERYLGVAEKDRYKVDVDSVKIKEKMRDVFKTFAEQYLGVKPRQVYGYEISQIGATPDEPSVVYSVSCDADGLVKRAGRDIIVSLGRLIGDAYEFTGSERERMLDAVRTTPSQNRFAITLEIPQGYMVKPSSIDALTQNVANECGAFYSGAQLKEDGKLHLQVQERYLQYVVPVDKWGKYLELADASAAFNNVSVVLTPVD